jgi:multidrug efflux system outer membrane protein
MEPAMNNPTHRMRRMFAKFPLAPLMLAASALLAACAHIDTSVPPVELPAMTDKAPANADRFWTLFEDEQLTKLVEEALANNRDLKIAVARIEESRANLRIARSALYPSLDANASAARNKVSGTLPSIPPGSPLTFNTFDVGVSAAYEVDLWGKLAAGRDAAGSTLLATRYAAETVRIALASQVASTYFALRSLDADLRLTRETLGGRDENVRLQTSRRTAGVTSELDLRLAEAERANVAATIPPLERAVAQTEAALARLTGRGAKDVFSPLIARGRILDEKVVAPEIPSGLPSDLLVRRPDVRQAESALIATRALTAEARGQYFPSLTLTGSLGQQSGELSDLFNAPSRVWSVAAGLLQPIIGLKRIEAQVDAATSRSQQAAFAYQQSVVDALRDVHDALVAHSSARAAFEAQDDRRNKQADVLRLAELRYRNGYSSYLEVLDAQRNLFDADRSRLAALRDRQTAIVDLYRALGGGWTPDQVAAR